MDRKIRFSAKFSPRDVFFGLQIRTGYVSEEMLLDPEKILYLYICLIPCFPILIAIKL